VLTRRELAALALAAAATPLAGCGYPHTGEDARWQDVGPLADLPDDTFDRLLDSTEP